MKLRYLVLLTIAAYTIVVAFRSALRQPDMATVTKLVAEKKNSAYAARLIIYLRRQMIFRC